MANVAGDVCLRRPRPNQDCRSDDDDDDDCGGGDDDDDKDDDRINGMNFGKALLNIKCVFFNIFSIFFIK